MDRYDFDSILFPVNFACMFKGDFGPKVMSIARKKGAAMLAIKPFAKQSWGHCDKEKHARYHRRCWYEPITDKKLDDLSLRFTLSQAVTSAIPPADLSFLPRALELGLALKPITDQETAQLKSLATTLHPIFARA
jgi:hypothetical protein